MSLLAALVLRRRKRRIFLVTALILFYVFSNNTLLNTFIAPWEKDGVVKVEKTYDVGIVLGGWIAEEDQRLDRVVFKKVPDRLFQAYRLYRQGKVKKLLISGGSGHYLYPHKKEALAIERYLLSIGVPQEDILTESQSRNTHENAVYTQRNT
ncbi:MAG: YdcF family protein [Bacteroidales bacterium]|nr:YdcF family protein [Bacteroidales bacterium]